MKPEHFLPSTRQAAMIPFGDWSTRVGLLNRLLITAALAASLFTTTLVSAEEVSGFAKGTIHPLYNAPGTPLLDQFYYRFTSDDHHIRHISDQPESAGTVMVAFHDQNWDDQYFYRVAHQRVPSAGIYYGSFNDVCVGSCTRTVWRPLGNYVFVLRGVRFYFHGTDHHIDEVGVIENGGRVTTWFNDKNNDDTFITYIDYAWVPQSRFSTVSEISGRVYTNGGTRRLVPVGDKKVIRGFRFDYVYDDHHIKEMGIMTNWNSIDVYYGDKNGDDDFDYRVKYAILN